MRRFIEQTKEVLWIAGVGIVVVLWAFSTFSTAHEAREIKGDLEKREASMRSYVDSRHMEVSHKIEEVKEVLEKLDKRSIETLLLIRQK